jgi:hypothetical protein
MRERILVLRDKALDGKGPDAARLKYVAEVPPDQCGSSAEPPERIFTVNGVVRP